MDGQVIETIRAPMNLGALRFAGRVVHPNVTATSRDAAVAVSERWAKIANIRIAVAASFTPPTPIYLGENAVWFCFHWLLPAVHRDW